MAMPSSDQLHMINVRHGVTPRRCFLTVHDIYVSYRRTTYMCTRGYSLDVDDNKVIVNHEGHFRVDAHNHSPIVLRPGGLIPIVRRLDVIEANSDIEVWLSLASTIYEYSARQHCACKNLGCTWDHKRGPSLKISLDVNNNVVLMLHNNVYVTLIDTAQALELCAREMMIDISLLRYRSIMPE